MLIKQPSRPLCQNCKFSLAKKNGISKHGFTKWHKYCSDCAKSLYSEKYKHLKSKKTKCQVCGFIPKDKCQMDLIYIDGNKQNKLEKNLASLCANCSRLYRKQLQAKKKSILNVTVDADISIS